MISITELPQTEELIEVKSANANGMIFNVGDIVYSTAYRLHTLKTETIKEATICKLKIKKIEFEPRTNWSVIIRQTDYKQECISKLPSNVFDKDGKSVCTIPAYYFTASVVEQENGTKFLYELWKNTPKKNSDVIIEIAFAIPAMLGIDGKTNKDEKCPFVLEECDEIHDAIHLSKDKEDIEKYIARFNNREKERIIKLIEEYKNDLQTLKDSVNKIF